MPASEKSSRTWATMGRSCRVPTAANWGAACPEMIAGRALCAATQIKHDADSVWLG